MLACTKCNVGYERTFTAEGLQRHTTARALAFGWPVERCLGCELFVAEARHLFGEDKATTWQVRRAGLVLGVVSIVSGPRRGKRYGAAVYAKPRPPFHPRYTDWRDSVPDVRADDLFPSRRAAVRWVLAQHAAAGDPAQASASAEQDEGVRR
ncbi:hypothetical protein C3Y87_17500 [Carbonactinospora thermoautotrophica]|uniref:hypothetical protein n=1 Tax=Carbonactinospora thermoautotrophica TaxID=1469144 RepID=UPI00226D9A41|nr:hypothetical protein [Carbonactinospora thermoautotrophica]MCX9193166.1 hypothetical protein [Carbonactinospora thermoautotrophica]